MKPEEKDLLLRDLCARLPYKVIVDYGYNAFDVHNGNYVKHGSKCILKCYLLDVFMSPRQNEKGEYIKPYLRPMSNMTEEEARDIAILHGNEPVDILSIKVTDEYIAILLDDGVCGTYTETIWYNEIISSLKCFDYLNKNMFDYRGLIPKDLALSTETFNPYKD